MQNSSIVHQKNAQTKYHYILHYNKNVLGFHQLINFGYISKKEEG
jgi:hypothetical protein